LTAKVTSGVTLNLGGRWYHEAQNWAALGGAANDAWQVAGHVDVAATEALTLSGEVGAYDSTINENNPGFGSNGSLTGSPIIYGSLGGAWAPGGGLTTSLVGTAQSNNAYVATFKAAKNFQ
jgi:hypothetical protein